MLISASIFDTNHKNIKVYNNSIMYNKIDGLSVVINYNKIPLFKEAYAYNYVLEPNEWYPYYNSGFIFSYNPVKYTEKELNLFTNILYRESGMSYNLNQQVDQYYVAICGIQAIIAMGKYETITELIKHGSSFTYPQNGFTSYPNDTLWTKCKVVCKNVLERNIPSFVPYIPMGTIAYWNDKIDTNVKQKNHLKDKYIKVATTIWGTDYYCHKDYISEKDLNYLLLKMNVNSKKNKHAAVQL